MSSIEEVAAESAPITTHDSFTVERNYRSPPSRVFAAFKDPAIKRRWLVEGPGFEIDEFTIDFRVGGREFSRFRMSNPEFSSSEMTNDGYYFDIRPNQRIVFGYSMTNLGVPFSASLATVTFEPAGSGTKLTYHEQCAFFEGSDGTKMRRSGWTSLLERLAEELGEEFSASTWG